MDIIVLKQGKVDSYFKGWTTIKGHRYIDSTFEKDEAYTFSDLDILMDAVRSCVRSNYWSSVMITRVV